MSYDKFKATRKTLKSKVTKLKNKVDGHDPTKTSLKTYDKIEGEYDELNKQIEANYTDLTHAASSQDEQDDVEKQQQAIDTVMQTIYNFLSACDGNLAVEKKELEEKIRKERLEMEERLELERIKAGIPSQSSTPAVVHTATPNQKPKLPQLSLPTFDGKFEDWLPFRDRFNQAVHVRKDLSGAEKLTYLFAALQGRAAEAIKSFPISDDNYTVACDRITKLFQHTREIAFKLADTIIDLPSTSRSPDSIMSISNSTSNALASIKAIDSSADIGNLLVARLVTRKLDSVTRERFNHTLSDSSIPDLQSLLNFLDKEILLIQPSTSTGSAAPQIKGNSNQFPSTNPSIQQNYLNNFQRKKCAMCNGDHPHHACTKLKSTPENSRKKVVDTAKLCTNCLAAGHIWKNCKSNGTCRQCSQKHHTLLHSCFAKATPQTTTSGTNLTGDSLTSTKLKPTACITISNHRGERIRSRAIIDNCSDQSFILDALVNKLGLQRQQLQQPHLVKALQGLQVLKATEFVQLQISSIDNPNTQVTTKALIVQKIGGSYPKLRLNPIKWSHIPAQGLADPEYFIPKKAEVLLSTDIYFHIIQDGILKGKDCEPVAQFSSLGWLVGGGRTTESDDSSLCNSLTTTTLDFDLQRFWNVEHGPSDQKILTPEETSIEAHYQRTTCRLPDGSYQVELPFKQEQPALGNSKGMAFRRFQGLESKLQKTPKLKLEYTQAINDLIQDGHVEPVPSNEANVADSLSYYLPHHSVLKESSTTTKIRIVFDASAKTSSGQSLNDQLMIGPVLQQDLTAILMRWRFWAVPLRADIKQMYLYVHMHPSDRDFQRIFWRDNPQQPLQCFRLRKVTFGTASAPYQAVKTLQRLAQDYQAELPKAAEILQRDFYVDDCLTGANSTEEAIRLQQDLVKLTGKANFILRKWISSDPVVMASIPPDMRESTNPLNLDKDEGTKALGLFWNSNSDDFRFHINSASPTVKPTKRRILSQIAQVFDSLGLISPVTVRAKMVMQELWKEQIGWDSVPSKPTLDAWTSYQDDLKAIQELRIPRCISHAGGHEVQFHGFSDASEKAYAAAVYLRTLTSTSSHTRLIISKTRVAPTKPQTLPKLELSGAVLLAQLMDSVKKAIPAQGITVAWTDSTITLAWIKSDPQKWKTFVRNRVITIQEIIPPSQWRHVPGTLNPADLPSRGITAKELLKNDVWFKGPAFLQSLLPDPQPVTCFRQDPDGDAYTPSTGSQTPQPPLKSHEQLKIQAEQKMPTGETHLLNSELNGRNSFDPSVIANRYSEWNRLRHHTAWWHRLHLKSRGKEFPKGPLSPAELRRVEDRWFRWLQRKAFAPEISSLLKDGKLPRRSPLLSLTPFIQNGLLRVGGRIDRAQIEFEKRHPVLLPRHHITDLIILHSHHSLNHAGTQLTLSMIQRRFWLIRGRSQVRRILNKCKTCVIQRAQTINQLMAELPQPRVNPSRPFTHVGVDYAGPVKLRDSFGRSPKTLKAYVAVYVCLCTKAVNLELVSSLSTDAFLASLRRFASRSGLPNTIQSDNGTNFVGANKELQEILAHVNSDSFQTDVTRALAKDGIKWQFIPPAAPHMGGLWEAAVKSAKFHLLRVIGKA